MGPHGCQALQRCSRPRTLLHLRHIHRGDNVGSVHQPIVIEVDQVTPSAVTQQCVEGSHEAEEVVKETHFGCFLLLQGFHPLILADECGD